MARVDPDLGVVAEQPPPWRAGPGGAFGVGALDREGAVRESRDDHGAGPRAYAMAHPQQIARRQRGPHRFAVDPCGSPRQEGPTTGTRARLAFHEE